MNTIKDRLFAILETVLKDSKFNAAFQPMIVSLAKSFLANTSDADLRAGIVQLRDVMIPWVLDGDGEIDTDKVYKIGDDLYADVKIRLPDENKNIE